MAAERRARRVLILCTGNSCRSQMAQGLVNTLRGDVWEARSAGTNPAAAVHPLAVEAMHEIGVDISAALPRHVEAVVDEDWDLVITVCDSARETCPIFPRPVEQIHVSFPDPAEAGGSRMERLAVFRTVREEIRRRLLPELDARARVGGNR